MCERERKKNERGRENGRERMREGETAMGRDSESDNRTPPKWNGRGQEATIEMVSNKKKKKREEEEEKRGRRRKERKKRKK